jgi:single-stranded-DNA-specific exonuclease
MSDFIDEMIRNSPEWVCQEPGESEIHELSRLTGFSRRVVKILWNREIRTKEKLDHYLRDDVYALHNPFLFNNMMEIVQRVRKAVYKKEKIFIFGDRDADGVLSTAMLFNLLHRFDADVMYRVPEGEFRYGIEKRDIDFAVHEGVSLIITVDTGISSIEEIVYAQSLGIDTIVMDHHIQPDKVPQAFSILNPKMKDEQYPFRYLSAGGVVLKFIHAFILSHTKNFNRTFVPLFTSGEHIEGYRVRNGLVGEHLMFEESIHYPIESNDTVVRDTHRELPEYFMSWLGEKKIDQLSILTDQEYSSAKAFTDIFVRIFMKKQRKSIDFVRSFIDLSALSTVSDIMPLIDENRIIVQEGLKQVKRSTNLGLRILLGYCSLPDRHITARDIAWNVSPVINSAGRMGDADIAVRLFTTEDLNVANELSRMLVNLNERRKEKGERNLNIIKPIIEDKYFKDPVIVLSTDEAEHGVTGIIASKISRKYSKPAFIIVNNGEVGIGSGRGGFDIDLVALVSRCEDLLVKYGGHKAAVGFTIDTSNIDQFRKRMHALVLEETDFMAGGAKLEIDDVIEPEDISFELYTELGIFEPTGPSNMAPRFCISGTTVVNPSGIGKERNHLRFFVPAREALIPVIGWGMADKGLRIIRESELVDIVFTIEDNYFRGERTLQLALLDIRKSEQCA